MLDKMRDNAQSWGIKIIFGIIILAFIFAFAGPGGDGDQVMAYVNGQPITVMDYQRLLSNQEDQTLETKRMVLGTMARNELIRQITQNHGIVITDAEVRSHIQDMPSFQTNGKFDIQEYKHLVQSPEGFELEIKDELLKAKMARFLSLPAMPTEAEVQTFFQWQNEQTSVDYAVVSAASFLRQAVVLPEDVQAYYEDNAFLYQQPERAIFQYVTFSPASLADPAAISDEDVANYYEKFSATLIKPRTATYHEIVLPVGTRPTQKSVDLASAKAKIILEKLASGTSFEELAKSNPRTNNTGQLKTAEMNLLPQAINTALGSLEIGGISQPIPTAEGLTIVKLNAIEEAHPYTLEEVHSVIVERLAEERGAEIMDDTVEEVIARISQGSELDKAVDLAGLTLQTSKPMSLDEFRNAFPMNEAAVAVLFELDPGKTTSSPIRIDSGYLLARKDQDLPAMILPIQDVRAEINAKMILSESHKLAEIEALSILTDEVQDATLIESSPFTRNGPIPVPDVDTRIVADAFTTEPGQWLPVPYPTTQGFLVARAKKRVQPTPELWEKQKSAWLQTAGEIARRELNMAFQQQIFSSADQSGTIEVVRGDLLQ